jgi:hypothetical protein
MYSWYKALTTDKLSIKYIRECAIGNPGAYFIYPQQSDKGLLYAVKRLDSTLTSTDLQVVERLNKAESDNLDSWKASVS